MFLQRFQLWTGIHGPAACWRRSGGILRRCKMHRRRPLDQGCVTAQCENNQLCRLDRNPRAFLTSLRLRKQRRTTQTDNWRSRSGLQSKRCAAVHRPSVLHLCSRRIWDGMSDTGGLRRGRSRRFVCLRASVKHGEELIFYASSTVPTNGVPWAF